MKKLVLSIGVIMAFALYSTHIKHENAESVAIVPKSTSLATPTSAPETTLSPSVVTDTHPVQNGKYKDGSYTGKSVDVFYGFVQVKAIVQNGQLADVQVLSQPNDRGQSIEINTQAMPFLQQEAIQAQSAKIDIVSGATDSSQGFIQSLDSALSQAI